MKIFLRTITLALITLGFWACSKPATQPAPQAASNIDYYTCTMHPSVHSKDPGECPLCSMDLVPVYQKGVTPTAQASSSETPEFSVPIERQQQIGVTYATIAPRLMRKEIRAFGVVEKVTTQPGVAVKPGDTAAAALNDLSKVWVWANFYESDRADIRLGAPATVISPAYPEKTFPGVVAVIEPFANPENHTTRVRIDFENPELLLRPGMNGETILEVTSTTALAVPTTAIMPTGLRNIAFVDKGHGRLEPREVTLGAKYGDFFKVIAGLKSGERVVNSANFLIDAESQVQGALSNFRTDPVPAERGDHE